jgi:hypothetical protein
MLLTHRKLLQSKAIAIENDLRGTLKPRRLPPGASVLVLRLLLDPVAQRRTAAPL